MKTKSKNAVALKKNSRQVQEQTPDYLICLGCLRPRKPWAPYSERETVMTPFIQYCECDQISED